LPQRLLPCKRFLEIPFCPWIFLPFCLDAVNLPVLPAKSGNPAIGMNHAKVDILEWRSRNMWLLSGLPWYSPIQRTCTVTHVCACGRWSAAWQCVRYGMACCSNALYRTNPIRVLPQVTVHVCLYGSESHANGLTMPTHPTTCTLCCRTFHTLCPLCVSVQVTALNHPL
jgi:hypothetical protein